MGPVAVFAIPETGHFRRLRPVISDLARGGHRVDVLTDRSYREHVESAGGTFVDLFAECRVEQVDDESIPFPCRYVTFAAARAEAVAGELERMGTSLVVYDTFGVVGRVAARLLGLPHVQVCTGHNLDPARAVAELETDPRVALSPACLRAVERLLELGIDDASPFSYVSGWSPFLNLYCEPAAWLTAAEREVFEPVAFYGSLSTDDGLAPGPSPFGPGSGLRVYASFGTVVWRYWAAEALGAMEAIAGALAERPGVRGLLSLGGTSPPRSLARPNVTVESYVDQRRVLQEADVFFTHQGLNSTHEAILELVPMISYPFFADQPGLAARCREYGVAVPLAGSQRGGVSTDDVAAALDAVAARREEIGARLAEARAWELDTIAGRGAVVERLTAFAEGR